MIARRSWLLGALAVCFGVTAKAVTTTPVLYAVDHCSPQGVWRREWFTEAQMKDEFGDAWEPA